MIQHSVRYGHRVLWKTEYLILVRIGTASELLGRLSGPKAEVPTPPCSSEVMHHRRSLEHLLTRTSHVLLNLIKLRYDSHQPALPDGPPYSILTPKLALHNSKQCSSKNLPKPNPSAATVCIHQELNQTHQCPSSPAPPLQPSSQFTSSPPFPSAATAIPPPTLQTPPPLQAAPPPRQTPHHPLLPNPPPTSPATPPIFAAPAAPPTCA